MRFWSFSTTVRNPDRIRSFLEILKELEGEEWNKETQSIFQIKLIHRKLYGYGNEQFYKGLAESQIKDFESEDFTYDQAKEIFESKKYTDPPMRGRQSFNPIAKLGFVKIIKSNESKKNVIFITELGNYFLQEDYDLKEVFLKSLLKWQYPNPNDNKYKKESGYDIKPFIATLKLISIVNNLCEKQKLKVKGVSGIEFALFFISLVDYKNIEIVAEQLINFRLSLEKIKGKQEQNEYIKSYFKNNYSEFESWGNAKDYSDNIIRYFRLTGFIYIRGNGFYIDIEPRRLVEINKLIEIDNASAKVFNSHEEYFEYIGNPQQPILPWEELDSLKQINEKLNTEVNNIITRIDGNKIVFKRKSFTNILDFNNKSYLKQNEDLRKYLQELNEILAKFESQNIVRINDYIDNLKNIYEIKYNKPVYLEKFIYDGLISLNDALQIKPNYPLGDDNKPTFTAPANKPDIECYYQNYNAICEVTLLTDRTQWYNEGQPILRHLRDFEKNNSNKIAYCIFVAPKLHRDTINTFWYAVKYEYEGEKQRIVPLVINQFIEILMILIKIKKNKKELTHIKIEVLFNEIIQSSNNFQKSEYWIAEIPTIIKNWGEQVVN